MAELFISDLHLSSHEPGTASRFQTFLAAQAGKISRLTILGDLFEYWAGDDDLSDPFNATIVADLRRLSDTGVIIDFMAGNRDFLAGDAFAAAAGLHLLSGPCVRAICGIKTLLSHGDELCTDDIEYQHFRAQVRQPAWRQQFLARPLAERKREIEALRRRSEAEKKNKPTPIMDVNSEAVLTALQAHEASALIHGHTHRQGQHEYWRNGRRLQRWVLGDWHPDRSEALSCDGTDWHWISVGAA